MDDVSTGGQLRQRRPIILGLLVLKGPFSDIISRYVDVGNCHLRKKKLKKESGKGNILRQFHNSTVDGSTSKKRASLRSKVPKLRYGYEVRRSGVLRNTFMYFSGVF